MKRRGLWIGALVAVLFGGILWLGAKRSQWGGGFSTLSTDLNGLRRDGAPTTYDELESLQPTEGENAYGTLHQAGALLKQPKKESALQNLWKIGPQNTAANREALKSNLALLTDVTALCRKASTMPRCVGPGQKIDVPYPTATDAYSDYFRFVSLLDSSAHYASNTGDVDSALKDLSAVKGLCGQLAAANNTLAFMSANTEYLNAINEWANCMNEHSNDRNVLLAGQHWLENPPPLASVRRGLASEIPDNLEGYRRALEEPKKFAKEMASVSAPVNESDLNPIKLRLAEMEYVHAFREVLEALPKDEADWKGAHAVFKTYAAKKFSGENPFDLYESISQYTPVRIAGDRIARQSIAILLYRKDHGSLPPALLLGGDDAIDPFNGKPLVYKKHGNGFEVYSVGSDMIDSGGSAKGVYIASYDPGMKFD